MPSRTPALCVCNMHARAFVRSYNSVTMGEKLVQAKPFVKWAGGKRSIINELLSRVPEKFKVYEEPFLGGGALFFALQAKKSYLSDINLKLISSYIAIRDDVDLVIENLKKHEKNHSKDYYYKTRERTAVEEDIFKLTAIFIYLNKTCYNGLYRVNRSGKFNVPIGRPSGKTVSIVNESNLRKVSSVLQDVKIGQRSFEAIEPSKNTFYYLDPPYYDTFANYTKDGFGEKEHKILAKKCKDIHDAGGFFMLSNSDNSFVRNLYRQFNIEEVMAGRYISQNKNQRGKEGEVLVRNYG